MSIKSVEAVRSKSRVQDVSGHQGSAARGREEGGVGKAGSPALDALQEPYSRCMFSL